MSQPSTDPYEVNYVQHEHKGWIAVWFSTDHGKFELLVNGIKRTFAGARFSPQYKAWYLGPGTTLAQLLAMAKRLDATCIRQDIEMFKSRAGTMTDEGIAKQLYQVWLAGAEAAREFGAEGLANMDSFRGWAHLPYTDTTEPVDRVHFLRSAREIRNAISEDWKPRPEGRRRQG
jgi:hypothetical protein